MARYQKKVVQIEAYKLGSENVPQWFENAIDDGRIESPMFRNYVLLNTQKGQIRGYQGDYMILNPDGSLYLCKKALFEATYEPSYEVDAMDVGCAPIPEIQINLQEIHEFIERTPDAAEVAEVPED